MWAMCQKYYTNEFVFVEIFNGIIQTSAYYTKEESYILGWEMSAYYSKRGIVHFKMGMSQINSPIYTTESVFNFFSIV